MLDVIRVTTIDWNVTRMSHTYLIIAEMIIITGKWSHPLSKKSRPSSYVQYLNSLSVCSIRKQLATRLSRYRWTIIFTRA